MENQNTLGPFHLLQRHLNDTTHVQNLNKKEHTISNTIKQFFKMGDNNNLSQEVTALKNSGVSNDIVHLKVSSNDHKQTHEHHSSNKRKNSEEVEVFDSEKRNCSIDDDIRIANEDKFLTISKLITFLYNIKDNMIYNKYKYNDQYKINNSVCQNYFYNLSTDNVCYLSFYLYTL